MALVFPSSPTNGQTYSSGSSATYQYDGSKWVIVTPPTTIFSIAETTKNSDWISAGTIQAVGITATGGTPPTLPNVTLRNNVSYRRVGIKTYEVVVNLHFTSATGFANGSGDYLFTLPAGLSFDTTLSSQTVSQEGVGANNSQTFRYQIPGSSVFYGRIADNYSTTNPSGVIVWDSTKYRVAVNNDATSYRCMGSAYCQIEYPAGSSWRFTFQTP